MNKKLLLSLFLGSLVMSSTVLPVDKPTSWKGNLVRAARSFTFSAFGFMVAKSILDAKEAGAQEIGPVTPFLCYLCASFCAWACFVEGTEHLIKAVDGK